MRLACNRATFPYGRISPTIFNSCDRVISLIKVQLETRAFSEAEIMKLITLIQAGALVLLAVYGAYAAQTQAPAPCTQEQTTNCDL